MVNPKQHEHTMMEEWATIEVYKYYFGFYMIGVFVVCLGGALIWNSVQQAWRKLRDE